MRAARRPPNRPPQRPAALLRARGWWVAGGLLLALATAGAVFSTASAASPETEQALADGTQKLFILRAFADDRALKPYTPDLWVSVRGTTAVVSGKLPSEMLKQRALLLARRVRGIEVVRGDELSVVTASGEPDLPSPFPDGLPTGRHKGERVTQVPQKADVPDPRPAPKEAVELLQPVPVGQSPRPAAEIEQPRALPPAQGLTAALEALRTKDARWRRVKVVVRQKTVYLGGTVPRWKDVSDLTDAVRGLPGVGAVVLDGLKVN